MGPAIRLSIREAAGPATPSIGRPSTAGSEDPAMKRTASHSDPRRRSLVRMGAYLLLALLCYAIVLMTGSLTLALGAVLFVGVFCELLFWREALFGHPVRDP